MAKSIILIGGKAGSGKDTTGRIIQEILGRTKILHFAQEVKEIAYSLGWDGKKDSLGRELLQRIGMAGRGYNENIWASKVSSLIYDDCIDNAADHFVIPDFRFPNEYAFIKNRFSWLRVYSFYIFGRQQKNDIDLTHISENSLSPSTFRFDALIENNEELKENVMEVLSHVCLYNKN